MLQIPKLYLAVALTGVVAIQLGTMHHSFFWDTVQLGSTHATCQLPHRPEIRVRTHLRIGHATKSLANGPGRYEIAHRGVCTIFVNQFSVR